MWWHKSCVYRWLVNFHNRKNVKLKSLCKAREQNNITQPRDLTIESARTGIEICVKHLNEMCPVVFAKRQKHLTEWLNYHRNQENENAQRNIEQMMNKEDNHQKWSRLRCATRIPWSQVASQVAVQDKYGQWTVVSGKASLNNAVAKLLDERYRAACDAPISSGKLFRDLGHLTNTESAEALFRGEYKFPKECNEAA